MRIAIIGYGGMGGYHGRLLRQYCGGDPEYPVELAGIYDISSERAAAARAEGIFAYESSERLMADDSVDAVLIATPNDVHAQYVERAAAAGKHIICEKPVGLGLSQAEHMYACAESAGVVFEVHQNRRWDDDFLTVKNIYDHREHIGDVYRIESRVMGGNGIPGDWRKRAAQGGGMMLDWGVHLIDQMFEMVKGAVVSLRCEYSYIYGEEVEDGCRLSVRFENGAEYLIVIATDCFINLPRWQLYGTEGTAQITDWDLSGGIVRPVVRRDEHIAGIRAGNGFTRTMAPRVGDSIIKSPLEIVRARPFEFYKNFAAACAGDELPVVRKEQVLRVCALMEAAKRSAQREEVIKERI